MREEWRPVVDCPGYQVSNLGQITGVRGGLLKQQIGSHDYLTVSIRGKTRCVHHLVIAAFVGPRPAGKVVRHRNDDRYNNRLSNLTYGTHSDNARDAVRNGRNFNANKSRCLRGHAFTIYNTGTHNNGKRYCISCNRALVAVTSSAKPLDLQTVADAKFAAARAAWLAEQKSASVVSA